MKYSAFATILSIFTALVGSGVLMIGAHTAAAQTTATSSVQLPVANVYIHNATIVNHSSNSVTVFFGIGNGVGAQPDVHYGLQLFKVGANGSQVLADQYIAPDTLSLTSGAPIMGHTLTYTAPAFFSGTYQVWVIAENSNGFPYSAVPAKGSVTFTPSSKGYVEILTPTCLLSVVGDSSHAQYSPQQGVDILPSETLVATCQVTNHFSAKEVIVPQFETRYRSEFGAVVPLASAGATTTLAANKTATLTFALPTAPDPQSYDVKLSFIDTAGAVVSNAVTFHYVVAGPSGTIQNATLDKNIYGVGDTAHATILWTPSADSFAGSRFGSTTTQKLIVEAALSSASTSIPCGAPVSLQVPASGPSATISIPLTAACINPSLLVSLKDVNGNLLDQKTFTVTSPVSSAPYKTIATIVGTIMAILVLYGIIHTLYLKKHAHSLA